MFNWKVLGFLAVGVLLLLGVILVAWLVPGENVTRGLIVASFLLTLLKAAYDVLDKVQERRRKEAESKERVKASPTFNKPACGKMETTEVVGAELYNEGAALVNIKRVQVVVASETGNSESHNLVSFEPWPVPGAPWSHPAKKIGPREVVRFHLPPSADRRFQAEALLTLAPENLCILIESYGGEVARVPGEQIQATILKNRCQQPVLQPVRGSANP